MKNEYVKDGMEKLGIVNYKNRKKFKSINYSNL